MVERVPPGNLPCINAQDHVPAPSKLTKVRVPSASFGEEWNYSSAAPGRLSDADHCEFPLVCYRPLASQLGKKSKSRHLLHEVR